MSWNQPSYRRFEQHPEEIAFSTISKQSQPIITQAEQSWIPQPQNHRTHRSRSLRTLVCEWKWELLTWLLGTCALGGIAALLVKYENRPLREWTQHVRPAPVIATLSQVAQSALLFSVSSCIGQLKWDWLRRTHSSSDLNKFEEASRGPKGSLMLLPRTRLHLVSIGALATVLLLIFSPSTQLSNTIKVRNANSTDTSSNVTISRSVQYMNFIWNTSLIDRGNRGPFNTSQQGLSNAHPHMSKAILTGVLDDQKSVSDITGNCKAEACKWEDYTTLAVCAFIDDVSSQGEVRNDSRKVPGFRLRGTSWVPPRQASLSVSDTFWMAAPFRDSSNITNEKLAPIAEIFVAYYPQCNENKQPRGTWDEWVKQLNDASNWKAYKGTLNLCLQTLSSTYNNTMKTTIIETQNELKWKSFDRFATNGTVCLTQPYNGDKFCVGEGDLMQWSTSLARTMEGAASIQEDSDSYYTGQWIPNILGDILGPTPAACDPNLGSGYELEGFTRRVNNIAIAMSNAMRTGNTTSPDSIVRGSAWTSEQYIAVDFKWLTPPLAIYLAITMFLFATIVKSRKANVPLWKSSPLVLLRLVERNNGMQTLKQVEKEAKETRVQLQYSGENWHLQDVTGRRT